MLADASPSWPMLLALGALHGLNPGMGWLFAVALGLQEGERRAVWRALPPLAAGHGLAIAAAVALAALAGLVVSLRHLQLVVALLLLVLGVRQLARHRHVRWGGMRMTPRQLATWSFLMASAHGAGLMALPFVLGTTVAGPHAAHAAHAAHATHATHAAHASVVPADQMAGLLAVAVHAVGYLAVTALLAVVVYEWLGLRLLRTAWVNLDRVWAGALVVTAVITLA